MSEECNIETIEIKSFRGIKNEKIDFRGKSFVLCGPNGTGKSSITQAFEYLFTGKIASLKKIQGLNHDKSLVHKGDSKDDLLVKATINGHNIERSFKDGFKYDEELEELVDDFKNGSFILNRKKLLSFIESRPGKRYEEITNLISFEKYDSIEKTLKQCHDGFKKEVENKDEEIEEIYNEISISYECEKEDIYDKINLSLKKNNISPIDENSDLKAFLKENKILEPHNLFKIDISKLNSKYLKLLNDYEDITLEELKSTNKLLSILTNSKEYILSENSLKCPVCESDIETEKVLKNIEPKIEEIKTDLKFLDNWKDEMNQLISELNNLNYELNSFNTINPQYKLEYDFNNFIEDLTAFREFDKKLSEMDKDLLTSMNDEVNYLKEKYESNNEELNKTLDNIFKLNEINDIKEDLIDLKKEFDVSKTIYELFRDMKKEEIENILTEIKDFTSKYYNFIHDEDDIINPDMSLTRSSSLTLSLFFDGESTDPRSYSSEGHIDSLGLCIFLAFARVFNKYNFMILDDIISTVDLEHKEQVIRLFFEFFGDYNFLITTHNKLWYEQLGRLASSHHRRQDFIFTEILYWDKKEGPIFSRKFTKKEYIETYIKLNDTYAAGNAIRRYLEFILHDICLINGIPLPLKKHYTVDDYYKKVEAYFNEILENTTIKKEYDKVFQELNNTLYMGNLLSHNNEANYDLSIKEIIKFKEAVFAFEKAFKCNKHKSNYLKFDKKRKIAVCQKNSCNRILKFNF